MLPAALAVMVMTMSGCGGTPPPDPPPSKTATTAPVFESEEEALAAATEAYAAYQEVLDEGFRTLSDSQLADVSTGVALEAGLAAIDEYRTLGHHQTGSSAVDTISLIDPAPALVGEEFQIYACLDVGSVDVVDKNGISVTPADRALRYPLVASLNWIDAERLVVSEEEQWAGVNFCE